MRSLAYAFAAAFLLAFLAIGGAAVYLAASRGAFSPAVLVEPGLAAEKGAGAWLYAVRTRRGYVLIDAGMDAKGKPIDAALRALGASREEVTDLFLTHGHTDHTAGAAALPRARVHSGAADVGMAATPDERGLESLLAPLLPKGPPRVDDPIDAERWIDLGRGDEVLAVPVPGHSQGSMAYLLHGVLYLGDAVSYEDGRLVATPRLFSADPDKNARSVAALAARLAHVPVRRICTGHGGCTPPGSASELLQRFVASLQ
jgi:glyoxylase-like metal-dependent hydrolase (beta-lactamase superfamily II)